MPISFAVFVLISLSTPPLKGETIGQAFRHI
jgi:hypothetical protein